MKRRPHRNENVRRLSIQPLESRRLLAADLALCVPNVIGPESQSVEVAFPQSAMSSDWDSSLATSAQTPKLISTASHRAEGEFVSAHGRSAFDSNDDGFVTPLDALIVLVHISRVQGGQEVTDAAAIRRFDTNGDNDVTPLDALVILTELSVYLRDHGGTMNVPIASWINNPTVVNGSLLSEDLSLRLDLADGVDAVFGKLQGSGGAASSVDLSSLISGGSVVLTHSQVVALFAPQIGNDLSFAFWTDLPDHAVQTTIEVTWDAPSDFGVLWTEDAENGLANVIDQTDASYPLIQNSVAWQGTRAFHLAHPTNSSSWFAINRTLAIRPDTKLFFMSRLSWATPTQTAKVQLSTDQGATWPITIFSQSGDAASPSGDRDFVFQAIDLSAYAGQNVRIRFFYEFSGGARYPQSTPPTGWLIDDIRIASEYETATYSIGQPTGLEQLLLEYTNRARADGIAEANRLANDPTFANTYALFGINPANIISQYTASVANGYIDRHAQPLAFNATLLQAARLHSQDMLTNAFQGHNSSVNPPAPFQSGFSQAQRAAALGYIGGVAENVYAFSTAVPFAHAGFAVDWGSETPSHPDYNPAFAGQGMQNPAGHRRNLHNGDFNEAGFAVVLGTNGSIGPQVVTQKMSDSRVPLITGVAYVDQDNNDFYTPGEGRGGIRVEVQGALFHAITSASGGYAVPVPGNGTYLVTFSGEGIQTWSTQVVVANESNVKVDYVLIA